MEKLVVDVPGFGFVVGLRRRAVAVLLAALSLAPGAGQAQDSGVFMRVADVEQGSVADVASRVEQALEEEGWTVLASYEAGIEEGACSFSARTIVVDWPEHTRVVMSRGTHGAYAAPFRIGIYEDELGVHVSTVNPRSINRTIVAEEGMEQDWVRLSAIVRRILAEAAGADAVIADYGQFRDEGRIGKTMGIMAGGPFLEKFKLIESVEGVDGGAPALAQRVFDALEAAGPGPEWGIRPVYVMTPAPGVAVMGVTGDRMEARSYAIVGRGGDKSRSDFACPGIDHAAAYPIEIVFSEEAGAVEIHMVDAMFRMKMFFEDAGKMKFARNMGMPGSIADEINELIRASVR